MFKGIYYYIIIYKLCPGYKTGRPNSASSAILSEINPKINSIFVMAVVFNSTRLCGNHLQTFRVILFTYEQTSTGTDAVDYISSLLRY